VASKRGQLQVIPGPRKAEEAESAIQELTGHGDLGTTQRYMHLTPAAFDAAIRLLDSGSIGRVLFFLDIVETVTSGGENR
jgi:hypothetical protein